MRRFYLDITTMIALDVEDEAQAVRIARELEVSIADAVEPYEPTFWTKVEDK